VHGQEIREILDGCLRDHALAVNAQHPWLDSWTQLQQKIAREVKRMVMMELQLPIDSKKEISGDLYYLKIAGLQSEISVKSADAPDSLIGGLPPGSIAGGQTLD
jgi:hypothetical protein